MVSLENLLLYIPLAALLVMLPGPDFALIVRTSLTEGRSSGQAAACGPGVRSRPPWCVTEGRKRKCSLSAACVAGPSGRDF